jgi:hypothetical protein
MEKDYSQPEDDGLLLISELERSCVRPFVVVCTRKTKHFPLLYLEIEATNERDAIERIQKQNPSVKALRAYQAK